MQSNQLSRRRFLQLAGTSAASVVLLAACQAPAAAPGAAGGGEAAAPGQAPVTLTFGHTWEAAFQAHQAEWDAKFLENHPNVKIEITYNTWADHNQIVPTWAAANTLPDIIYTHGRYAFPWNFEGIMAPTTDFIDADPEFDIKGIWEEALRLYQLDGKQYSIPYDHGPMILGYNKDLFDAAGVAYPDESWTWDTFLEAALKMTQENQWGYGGYYNTVVGLGNELGISLVGPWGGEVLDETETKILLDSAESTAALNWWNDLIQVHKAAPTPAMAQAIPAGPWVSGQAAMFALASWGTPTLIQNASFNWDVAPWPKGPEGAKTGSFGSGFGITRDSKNPEAAWQYLSEYLSKEGMEFMWGASGRGSPAREAAYESWMNSEGAPEHASYYLDALKNYAVTGRPYQTLAGGEILDIFNRNTQLVEAGELSVEDAIAGIIADGTPVLEAAAAKQAAK
ncbi:sugar ABC transporter substrate-binding protein [Caldilinea sp.]|uniref:ABC transporter substrate-binding protein n=1 Tax=Caldilinea sp. TaxID=2293560 RepID=UPI002BAEA7F0|nr:sugar ABC transporter substrate-binding protein [Anaerolineales bacterium]HQY92413.1 sugar ABC transporter substrate-binding protein [Caldilinea sp.]